MAGRKGAAARRANTLLDEAELHHTCLVPKSDSDRRCIKRQVTTCGCTFFSPLPEMYVRRSTWENLNPADRTLYVMRAVATLRPRTVFCAQSAALAWGLPVSWSVLDLPHVARGNHKHPCAYRTVREHQIEERGCAVGGFRVTSFWRTVFDCLASLPFPDALAIADAALRRTHLTRQSMIRLLSSRFRRRHGIRRALAICQWADPGAENGGESVARAHMILCGYTPPHLQLCLPRPLDESHSYRIDFATRNTLDELVFIELDGREKYGATPEQAESKRKLERRREALLTVYRARFIRIALAEAKDHATLCALFDLQLVERHEPPRLIFNDVPALPPELADRETIRGSGALQIGKVRTRFVEVNIREAA